MDVNQPWHPGETPDEQDARMLGGRGEGDRTTEGQGQFGGQHFTDGAPDTVGPKQLARHRGGLLL